MSKEAKTIKAIAAAHNVDPKDITSEVHAPDRPLIAEEALSLRVLDFCRAGNFQAAAAAIEIDVRLAYQVEGAA